VRACTGGIALRTIWVERRIEPGLLHYSRVAECAVLVLCLIGIGLPPTDTASARVDPDTGRVRLLHVGDAFNRPGFASYFFFQDPRIDIWAVPSEVVFVGEIEVYRYYRLYLPRTRERVKGGFDVICLTGCYPNHLTDNFLAWCREAVLEEAVGFLMADDPTSFGGRGGNPNWAETVLVDVIPVKCVKGLDWGERPFKVEVVLPEHPLVRGIPWEEATFAAHNRVYEKQGSTVVVRIAIGELPALAYMDAGRGVSVALVHDWGGRSLWSMSATTTWAWAPHFYCSLVYYSAKAGIPDAALDKSVREKFHTYTMQRLLVLSIIEFAETFGADSIPLLGKIVDLDQEKLVADRLYFEMDLEGSSEKMDALTSQMTGMVSEAMEAKDRALLWVYVVEWLVVAATSLFAGSAVYALMVRRRLYREAARTRHLQGAA
jgi:hypothetical protein